MSTSPRFHVGQIVIHGRSDTTFKIRETHLGVNEVWYYGVYGFPYRMSESEFRPLNQEERGDK